MCVLCRRPWPGAAAGGTLAAGVARTSGGYLSLVGVSLQWDTRGCECASASCGCGGGWGC